ncbi:MAG: hypothetical protein OSJ28_03225 [Desulfovibrio sp.]|jgi:hypothetical protein|nr:hypothetical protein [Desulfovibrio sp.]
MQNAKKPLWVDDKKWRFRARVPEVLWKDSRLARFWAMTDTQNCQCIDHKPRLPVIRIDGLSRAGCMESFI